MIEKLPTWALEHYPSNLVRDKEGHPHLKCVSCGAESVALTPIADVPVGWRSEPRAPSGSHTDPICPACATRIEDRTDDLEKALTHASNALVSVVNALDAEAIRDAQGDLDDHNLNRGVVEAVAEAVGGDPLETARSALQTARAVLDNQGVNGVFLSSAEYARLLGYDNPNSAKALISRTALKRLLEIAAEHEVTEPTFIYSDPQITIGGKVQPPLAGVASPRHGIIKLTQDLNTVGVAARRAGEKIKQAQAIASSPVGDLQIYGRPITTPGGFMLRMRQVPGRFVHEIYLVPVGEGKPCATLKLTALFLSEEPDAVAERIQNWVGTEADRFCATEVARKAPS